MRLDRPRVEPLPAEAIDPELRERLGGGPIGDGAVLNIFRTLAHHPELMKKWLVFGTHVLVGSTLPAREREIVILRIGWLCRSPYEWGQHVAIGRAAGLTDEEIERIADGPEAEGWSDFDRVLLRATDELHADAFVSDASWEALAARYTTQQCMDLVFCVGQYNLVSMVLNSLGVQPEPELAPMPRR